MPSAIFHANDTVNLPVKLCLYGYKLDTDIKIIADIGLTVNERNIETKLPEPPKAYNMLFKYHNLQI